MIGSYYKHYKTGGIYQLIYIGIHSETLEDMAVYQAHKDGRVWVRPKNMFFSKVVVNGVEVDRFERIVEETDV